MKERNLLTAMRAVVGQAISDMLVKLGVRVEGKADLDRPVDVFLRQARQAALNRSPEGQSRLQAGARQDLQFSKGRGSSFTRTGTIRRNPTDWRKTLQFWDSIGYDSLLSTDNRRRIKQGTPPLVDDQWIAIHPEDNGLRGEQIRMHHVLGLPITVPLPVSRHKDSHMPGGFRYNPGNVGSQLPLY